MSEPGALRPDADEGASSAGAAGLWPAKQDAGAQLEAHRALLTGHCYRMLGSAVDAEDAVQEALVRAWRGLDGFDGRASLRTWLYRIATNVCLDALADRQRRLRPLELGGPGTAYDELEQRPHSHWLEPIPDARALPAGGDPAELAALRQSIRLAFVAALQQLPARQRAALLLAEVLGWSAAEVAECLQTSVPAVNSALQRARATLAQCELGEPAPAAPLSTGQRELLARFVDAFERYDIAALVELLRRDAVMSMPPYALWLRGPDSIAEWLRGRGLGCQGSRLVPTAACGGPAFGQYREGGRQPWALVALELAGDRIAAMTYFLDTASLFPIFGLPRELAAGGAELCPAPWTASAAATTPAVVAARGARVDAAPAGAGSRGGDGSTGGTGG